jgi:ketosteroid isomerase-like protein
LNRIRVIVPLGLMLLAACTNPPSGDLASLPTPARAVEGLLAADRAFGTAAAHTDAITTMSNMLDDDAMVANNAGGFAEGKPAVIALLRGLPLYTNARLEWAPIRGGISADGSHGFTHGYMTVHRPDSADVQLKYLAHWVKKGGAWRMLTMNRRARPAGAASLALLPALLPPRSIATSNDAARLEEYRRTMAAAEQAFSDRAQTAGLGPAFAYFGHPEAMNLGAASDAAFVSGPEAIARLVGANSAGKPSPVSWSAAKSFVASSGDLGINFGIIRENAPEPGATPGRYPFFTVWYRKSIADPWRYVAE